MSWRTIVEPVMVSWPPEERQRAMSEMQEGNDLAERLGFTCHLDVNLGYGGCYYTSGPVRVCNSPDGWCRAQCVGIVGEYNDHKYYHTLSQALKDENPRASRNRYGVLRPIRQ